MLDWSRYLSLEQLHKHAEKQDSRTKEPQHLSDVSEERWALRVAMASREPVQRAHKTNEQRHVRKNRQQLEDGQQHSKFLLINVSTKRSKVPYY